MTDEERNHAAMLMAEVEHWKQGDPSPEHSLSEHLKYVRLSIDDLGKDIRRATSLTILWIVVWAVIIVGSIYGLIRASIALFG